LEIIKTGELNSDAGPDFFNARIRTGETIWAGNVEAHIKASDWIKHGHGNDPAYDNIVLHVVLEADVSIARNNGQIIPCLELRYDKKLESNYKNLMESEKWIPCQEHFHRVDSSKLKFWLGKMAVDKIAEKSAYIETILSNNKSNWSQTFYQVLARNFGFKTNSEPFELLAKSLPLNLLARHKGNLFQIEALLFGQSGLLHREILGDDYFLNLRKEFEFLQKKYGLKPLPWHLWKFLRLRPNNFPTVRIAQFAALINRSENLFTKVVGKEKVDILKEYFRVVSSDYWHTHYDFNKPSVQRKKYLGNDAIELMLINTVIPFIFAYGVRKQNEQYREYAVQMLEEISVEKNNIIRSWKKIGVAVEDAFYSQALLQLKTKYCDAKRCINCEIGNEVILSV